MVSLEPRDGLRQALGQARQVAYSKVLNALRTAKGSMTKQRAILIVCDLSDADEDWRRAGESGTPQEEKP